ncbi:TetR/AcrR family transcriptional regulator [Williamsia soli]|uniref:TetR/AcrR family transcriptional regulator n=1 Tax=Williamsia soli TaxID=364929 RepID=UPI001F33E0EF|nr:TetR/AcrR family transcriptional regulator [Williamsia soli]
MTQDVGTRARLVQAGVELLEDGGLPAVGLRAITRAAGVSHGAPRRYFPTHRALLAAIAEAGFADLRAELEPALCGPGPADLAGARARLLKMAGLYVAFARRRPDMFALIFRHDLLKGAGENLRDKTGPVVDALAGLIGGHAQMHRALKLWTSVHGVAMLTSTRALDLFDADVDALVAAAVDSVIAQRDS